MTTGLKDEGVVLALAFVILVLLPCCALGNDAPASSLEHHGGPLLGGDVNVSLLWYGRAGRVQKNAVQSFLKSLNFNGEATLQPQVSSWWKTVESYQNESSPIRVQVTGHVSDTSYSVGNVLTEAYLPPLLKKATGGKPDTIAVIIADRQVTVHGLCYGKCYAHGVLENQTYILVGNPETQCPSECAWPFVPSTDGPQGLTLLPPSGNVGADAIVMNLASALAATVTNPFKDGWFSGFPEDATEATTACPAMFGSGAIPGHPGKVRIDPSSGAGFNAHGRRGKRFLLPAIWNPATSSCWTLM